MSGNIFSCYKWAKLKAPQKWETRDANKHLRFTEKSLTRKKKIQAQNITNAKRNSSKGQGFWNQNI